MNREKVILQDMQKQQTQNRSIVDQIFRIRLSAIFQIWRRYVACTAVLLLVRKTCM